MTELELENFRFVMELVVENSHFKELGSLYWFYCKYRIQSVNLKRPAVLYQSLERLKATQV